MPIDYLALVKRLGGLSFPPQTPEAWMELARVLKKRAKSPDHAERIVGRFLEPGAPRECPTPGELASMAMSVPADAKLDRPDLAKPCVQCIDFGGAWRMNKKGGMERCNCARGLKLAAMDAARSSQQQEEPRKGGMQPADFARLAAGDKECD